MTVYVFSFSQFIFFKCLSCIDGLNTSLKNVFSAWEKNTPVIIRDKSTPDIRCAVCLLCSQHTTPDIRCAVCLPCSQHTTPDIRSTLYTTFIGRVCDTLRHDLSCLFFFLFQERNFQPVRMVFKTKEKK
ncbi:unnamed protein product [Lymnaea stagnalis]|uniref:Uncharacterized protein n=1 Tax=Lymnaea stagnalis TaxID=6523 RepID=A0AAV2GYD4_LYMST